MLSLSGSQQLRLHLQGRTNTVVCDRINIYIYKKDVSMTAILVFTFISIQIAWWKVTLSQGFFARSAEQTSFTLTQYSNNLRQQRYDINKNRSESSIRKQIYCHHINYPLSNRSFMKPPPFEQKVCIVKWVDALN